MEPSPHTVSNATQAKPKAPVAPPRADMRVRAIAQGHYPDPGQLRSRVREIGDVFVISKMEHFSPVDDTHMFGWMEWAVTPPKLSVEPPLTTLPNLVPDPSQGISGGAPTGAQTPAGSFVDTIQKAPSAETVAWPVSNPNGIPADAVVPPLPDKLPPQTKPAATEDF